MNNIYEFILVISGERRAKRAMETYTLYHNFKLEKKNPIGEKYGNIANPKFKIKRNLFPNLF